jgi:hypothetical protein
MIQITMEIDDSGNHRRESNRRSYTSTSVIPIKDKRIEYHAKPKGEERARDIRSACEAEVQAGEPTLLSARVLCEHSEVEFSDHIENYAIAGKTGSGMDRITAKEAEDPFRSS